MATPAERRALLFLAALAALGGGMRLVAPAPRAAERGDAAGLARQIAAVDSAVTAGGRSGRARRTSPKARPAPAAPSGSAVPRSSDVHGVPAAPPRAPAASAPPEAPAPLLRSALAVPPALVDVDRAPAAELERLPWIGPALARRMVEERARRGPFGSLEGLQRVRGIGPGIAARLAGRVTFSGVARPAEVEGGASGGVVRP